MTDAELETLARGTARNACFQLWARGRMKEKFFNEDTEDIIFDAILSALRKVRESEGKNG